MPSFLSFSDEIVDQIIQYQPLTVQVVNRRLHNVSLPHLYNSLTLDLVDHNPTIHLLYNFIQNRSLGGLVRKLDITWQKGPHRSPGADGFWTKSFNVPSVFPATLSTPKATLWSDGCKYPLQTVISAAGTFNPELAKALDAEGGDENALVLFLLSMLPNLDTLHLAPPFDFRYHPRPFFVVLERFIPQNPEEKMNEYKETDPEDLPIGLRKVRSLTVRWPECTSEEGFYPYKLLGTFFLPNLTSLKLDRLTSRTSESSLSHLMIGPQRAYLKGLSKIRDLVLERAQLDTAELLFLLDLFSPGTLREFRYVTADFSKAPQWITAKPVEGVSLAGALQHQKETLEVLQLDLGLKDSDEPHHLGCFGGFAKLGRLALDGVVLGELP
ncbi:hypothetical protein DL96DRAFT_1045813 [Flagelloscypha sp. PMI_526]|nr:hypothetical protein DL96DRAFT_1045813 [Flagelloscypha sp. PMI_526]